MSAALRRPLGDLFNRTLMLRRPTDRDGDLGREADAHDHLLIVALATGAIIGTVSVDDLFDPDGMRFEADL